MPSAPAKSRPAGYRPPTYQATRNKAYDRTAWRKYRAVYLAAHPLCVLCQAAGLVKPARCVDHKRPVRDEFDPRFWDPTNHQPLCHECHSRKTARETRAGLNRKRG